MGRRKKKGFSQMKMLSSRVEETDYLQFEQLIKERDHKTLQEMVNLFVVNYISGTIVLSGSCFVEGEGC